MMGGHVVIEFGHSIGVATGNSLTYGRGAVAPAFAAASSTFGEHGR
ncbi:MAG: hypothetical protein IPH03_01810 [Tetrasphaera sp.]|jgi:hypothetical protein|nr:hypothetical protein [Tetrasphaera sp.]